MASLEDGQQMAAAILIRLAAIDRDLLEKLITDPWRLRAPRTR